jgi:hypothetical protein
MHAHVRTRAALAMHMRTCRYRPLSSLTVGHRSRSCQWVSPAPACSATAFAATIQTRGTGMEFRPAFRGAVTRRVIGKPASVEGVGLDTTMFRVALACQQIHRRSSRDNLAERSSDRL